MRPIRSRQRKGPSRQQRLPVTCRSSNEVLKSEGSFWRVETVNQVIILGRGEPHVPCAILRAAEIAAHLDNGGTIENAQAMAAHEWSCATKLYHRTSNEVTLDKVGKVAIQAVASDGESLSSHYVEALQETTL